ncbi:MAG: hypothetical protein RIF32_20820 [Leptospirales bacterium]
MIYRSAHLRPISILGISGVDRKHNRSMDAEEKFESIDTHRAARFVPIAPDHRRRASRYHAKL